VLIHHVNCFFCFLCFLLCKSKILSPNFSWDCPFKLSLAKKVKKHNISDLRQKPEFLKSFIPTLRWREIFLPYGKILSPCGKFNNINAKLRKQKNLWFSLCGNWLRVDCVYSGWRIYSTARDFYRTGRKISRCAGTCPGHVLGYEQSGTPYILNFKI
jgi:NAD-dependent dihydropyrimidine dehydrogenase PreA subunit